jgi:hypothetical protein
LIIDGGAILTLIGLGEVKVDLTDFDLKLQEIKNFKIPIFPETSSKSL